MSTIDANKTIAELVTADHGLTRVFERLGIDFCCGGKQTLAAVCAQKGLDVNSVVTTLNAVAGLEPASGGANRDWTKATMTELCDHIEQTHHQYLKEELPRVTMLVNKIAGVHGANHPELAEVRQWFGRLSDELLGHLPKEERILFPAIRRMEQSGGEGAHVMAPIQVMEAEHESAGQALEKLRELTHGYAVPADGCRTYQATMEALAEVERDTHQHIHLENNILFPRALAFKG